MMADAEIEKVNLEIEEVKRKIEKVEQKIEKVEQKIEKVEQEVEQKVEKVEQKVEEVKQKVEKVEGQIEAVQEKLAAAHSSDDAPYLRNKEDMLIKLMDEKNKLMDEKNKLMDEKNKLMDEKNKVMDDKNKLEDMLIKLMDEKNKLMDEKSELTKDKKDKRLREEENQPGREKGLTSELVSTDVENIHSKLDFMSALMQESLSRTRAASTINVDDLRVLRRALDTAPLPEEEDVPLRSLLGPETEVGESFWDGDTYELQLKDEYIRQFKKMTACRDVHWNDANGMKIKRRFTNAEFPVVAKNDLVLSLRRFGSLMSVGAILGVEIKRKLSWRGLRQAEVEFYVWASESLFPFVQLITDMERGGVAIYSKGGNDVRFRTLGSMEAVRNFVSGIVKSLPPGAGEDDSENGFINPDTFLSPSRKRWRLTSLGMSSANPQGGSSSIGRQMAFWSMAAAINNNLGDVANLRDLDCFNVDPVL